MQNRLPDNIAHTVRVNADFTDTERSRLLALADSIRGGARIPEPGLHWHDYEWWTRQYEPHRGDTWHDSNWFFSETYAFRLILDACRYWQHGRDPFWHTKKAELDSAAAFAPIMHFDSRGHIARGHTDGDSGSIRLAWALQLATWGNRADLSFSAGAEPDRDHGTEDQLIVNDTVECMRLLDAAPASTVHLVTDNSGAELAGDLVLIRELVRLGHNVVCHVKAHPTYVSDTTVADFHYFLTRAAESDSKAVQSIACDIQQALNDERVELRPHAYWCSTLFLSGMPDALFSTLESAGIIIIKGDFNYRRVFQDTIWPVGTPLAQATGLQMRPRVLLLRGMKSDVIWGLEQVAVEALDTDDADWRINGRRAVIQLLDFDGN